ncbi:hypothetical protein B0H14DRAFT_304879 [Mycena olivaceomarginata]|nr:hypothetical protein B0H14DRAFT_304879 [Mycena olivaceomarginata]
MSNLPAQVDSASPEFHFFLRRCPCSRYVARHFTSALPPPLPIATSAPHPANVSTSTSTSGASSLTLTGYDSSLSSASYPESPSSDFSPSRPPPRSSRRWTRRTPPCTRRAPSQTRSLAVREHGHVNTLNRAPRYPAPTHTFLRVASAAPPLATVAAAALAGPAPSLALSPGSCRSFSGRVTRHSAFGEVAENQRGAYCVLHPASSIQHSVSLPSSSISIALRARSSSRARVRHTSAAYLLQVREGEQEARALGRP